MNSRRTIIKIYVEMYNSLCSFADKIVKNKEDSEDIVQSIFYKVLNNNETIPEFKNVQENKKYIYRAVKNYSINLLKKRISDKKKIEEISKLYNNEDVLEIQILRDETLQKVFKIIDIFPDKRRKIFILAYYRGLSNKEIADNLNISVNTVKTHKHLAKKHIRKIFKIK